MRAVPIRTATTFDPLHRLPLRLRSSKKGRKIQPVYFAVELLFVDAENNAKMRTEDWKAEIAHLMSVLERNSRVRYSDGWR